MQHFENNQFISYILRSINICIHYRAMCLHSNSLRCVALSLICDSFTAQLTVAQTSDSTFPGKYYKGSSYSNLTISHHLLQRSFVSLYLLLHNSNLVTLTFGVSFIVPAALPVSHIGRPGDKLLKS